MKHLIGAGLTAATLLTACGGSITPPSAAALGQKLDCFSAPEIYTTEMFARETAACNFQMDDQSSQHAIITTFGNADDQANYAKAVDSLGGTRVNGKLWTIALDGQVAGAAAQNRLGGVLK
jgi:hypothetical protein